MRNILVIVALSISSICVAESEAPVAPCKIAAESGKGTMIEACYASKFKLADTELNVIYKKLLSVLQNDNSQRDHIIKSQRAWLVYREQSCGFWNNLLSYNAPACRKNVTEFRVNELKHMHGCIVEGGSEC